MLGQFLPPAHRHLLNIQHRTKRKRKSAIVQGTVPIARTSSSSAVSAIAATTLAPAAAFAGEEVGLVNCGVSTLAGLNGDFFGACDKLSVLGGVEGITGSGSTSMRGLSSLIASCNISSSARSIASFASAVRSRVSSSRDSQSSSSERSGSSHPRLACLSAPSFPTSPRWP